MTAFGVSKGSMYSPRFLSSKPLIKSSCNLSNITCVYFRFPSTNRSGTGYRTRKKLYQRNVFMMSITLSIAASSMEGLKLMYCMYLCTYYTGGQNITNHFYRSFHTNSSPRINQVLTSPSTLYLPVTTNTCTYILRIYWNTN